MIKLKSVNIINKSYKIIHYLIIIIIYKYLIGQLIILLIQLMGLLIVWWIELLNYILKN